MIGDQAGATPGPGDGRAVTIGVFDGVHAGHRALLTVARAEADALAVPLTVLTFDPHPMSIVRPELAPCRLASIEQRRELLLAAGADDVTVVPFDLELSRLTPAEFVQEWLVERLAAVAVITGDNFRFGHRAAGDLTTLRELGADSGFTVTGVTLATADDAPWSSTRIRAMIGAGDVAGAARGLGRPYRLDGMVVRGAQRGRELGYPTANLAVDPATCVPADGVYAARAVLPDAAGGQRRVGAAVSIGANTTFGESTPQVEAYLLEPGPWDLYDTELALDFVARIRDMATFADADLLREAMADDVANAVRLLS